MDGNRLISVICMVFIMMSVVSLSGKNTIKGTDGGDPIAVIDTNMGTIKVELFEDDAPITVDNFKRYANDGFYDGLIFHRVVENFVIQGGGLYPDMRQKETTYGPIKNEAEESGHKNKRGTIAMARLGEPDSATSQFFINLRYNEGLDWDKAEDGYGYCVFGQVIEGMDVVDSIGSLQTETVKGFENVPVQDVVINSVTIQEGSTNNDNGDTNGGAEDNTDDSSTVTSSSSSSPFYTNFLFIEAIISVIIAVGIILFLRSREEEG